MIEIDALVVGGGPAGICAASTLAEKGLEVWLVDENDQLGGQLVKQTHKFFGSKEHYAGVRGIDIPQKVDLCKVKVLSNTSVLGCYKDGVYTLIIEEKTYIKVKPKGAVIATGAQEKFLPFEGNDLPGVYGAGAVQTLMNKEGILPGKKVLMIGAGNIGLIVSYQLLQAGVEVVAVIEGADRIGGYWVHSAKVARASVPILTNHTILKAVGKSEVEGAVIAKLNSNWEVEPNSEQTFEVDTICLSVGLAPINDLLWQRGCQMQYVKELGGYVPSRNKFLKTSVDNIYVAGDVSGIEEASSAMVEGKVAGLALAMDIKGENFEMEIEQAFRSLKWLREGETALNLRKGLEKIGVIEC
ncbi:NAD(P)/FAD-dependent oxidoreductase [Proteinivorax hydrogeniformans]|uniref:NAD(P)/FAD-dependent oxidoreductase n=1 Tax=Proteinivorax hydrogeniformans TaxID=1826727 RepID=A0AAU8HWI5_9FIRM